MTPRPFTARTIAWNTIAQLVSHGTVLLVSVGTTMLLTRHLGVAGYGSLVTVLAYLGVTSFLFDWGTQTILVRELSRPGARVEALVGTALTVRVVLAVAAMAVSVGAMPFVFHGQRLVELGILLALPRLLTGAVVGTATALLQARMVMGRLAAADFCTQVLTAAALVAAVYTGRGFGVIVAVYTAGALLNAGAVSFLAGRLARIRPRLDRAAARRLIREALPLGLALLINTIYFRAGVLLLSALRGPHETGVYALPQRVVEVVIVFPAIFIGSVFPLLAQLARDGALARLRESAQRAFEALLLVTLPFVVGTIVLAPGVVRILGGDGFERAVPALRIVVVGAGLMAVNGVLGHVLIALDRQKDTLWLNVVALGVNLAANAVLIPRFGALAAASVLTGSEVLMFAGALWFVRHYAGWRVEVGVATRGALAAAAMGTVLAVAHLEIVLSALLGVALYAAALWLLRVHERVELRSLLRPGSATAERSADVAPALS